MRLQKNTLLALYSVLEFARSPDRHFAAAEIADKYSVSAHHLAKVLADLARSGLLVSVRGAGGGYRFTGNAKRLTLMDIIQMFENFGDPATPNGMTATGEPVEKALGTVLFEIDENARATFKSITLATMMRLIDRQHAGPAADAKRSSGLDDDAAISAPARAGTAPDGPGPRKLGIRQRQAR